MPENSEENSEKKHKNIKISSKENHLLLPGGYFCNEKMDDIAKANAETLRILDQITSSVNISREDIFRLISKIYDQTHKSNNALTILRMIYK